MGAGELMAGLARVVEWVNVNGGFITVFICAFLAGMCFWAGLNCLLDARTIKPKSNKRNIDTAIAKEREQLRTASSTHTLCFGCMFEISGGLECWSCVRRSNLKDNFRARRVGGGVG